MVVRPRVVQRPEPHLERREPAGVRPDEAPLLQPRLVLEVVRLLLGGPRPRGRVADRDDVQGVRTVARQHRVGRRRVFPRRVHVLQFRLRLHLHHAGHRAGPVLVVVRPDRAVLPEEAGVVPPEAGVQRPPAVRGGGGRVDGPVGVQPDAAGGIAAVVGSVGADVGPHHLGRDALVRPDRFPHDRGAGVVQARDRDEAHRGRGPRGVGPAADRSVGVPAAAASAAAVGRRCRRQEPHLAAREGQRRRGRERGEEEEGGGPAGRHLSLALSSSPPPWILESWILLPLIVG